MDIREERVKKAEGIITDIEESINFTQRLIDDKMKELSTTVGRDCKDTEKKLYSDLQSVKTDEEKLKEKIRVLEDRNRRNNLWIDGIKETENETWTECERKIKDVLKHRLRINENIEIERAHRMGRKDIERRRPRTIIFKLLNWKDKELILNNRNHLKNSGIYINEDFSEDTMRIRKELFKQMKVEREKGKFSVVVYDKLITRNFRS